MRLVRIAEWPRHLNEAEKRVPALSFAVDFRPSWALIEGYGNHPASGTLRRRDRRRWPLGRRRGLSLAAQVPEEALRHSGGARLHRWHLGSVPLSGHSLRQRHVHARLRSEERRVG